MNSLSHLEISQQEKWENKHETKQSSQDTWRNGWKDGNDSKDYGRQGKNRSDKAWKNSWDSGQDCNISETPRAQSRLKRFQAPHLAVVALSLSLSMCATSSFAAEL
eukprot:1442320-Amphidinium_carterae.1